jgi:histidyl-tRNA synthetase
MPKRFKYQTLAGVHDILPSSQKYYQKIYEIASKVAAFYNFKEIQTPIFEKADLFKRAIGASTEIVQKQMYIFKTKGRDEVALRPEATASLARAFLEHGMQSWPQPVRLWTFGPFYRYEKPQAGRYRQFYQVNFEIFGEASPVIDAQIIQIFYKFFNLLKIKNIIIEINSIGDSQCRPYYKKLLANYLKSYKKSLCSGCKDRLKENPLRILDCKQEKCQRIIRQAPQIIDHLCKECKEHFKELLEFLDELEIVYSLNPYLVRGLDYYTRTVFEIFFDKESKSIDQNFAKQALAGGGRYDNLLKILGGQEIPAIGGAAGIERTIEIIRQEKIKLLPPLPGPEIFLAQLGKLAKRKGLKLFEELRKAKIRVAEAFGKDSLKSQLKLADKLGVKYVLILGQREAMEKEIIIRDMKTGKQITVKLNRVIKEIEKRLKEK